MAEQKNSGGAPKWVWGCGIGCLALALIGAVLLVVLYFGMQKAMKTAGRNAAAGLKQHYETLKSENKVPAEQLPLYDELVGIAQQENASFLTTTAIYSDVQETFSDGAVTDEEAKRDATVRDFFKANPDCGLTQFAQFVKDHPEFKELLQKMKESPPKP